MGTTVGSKPRSSHTDSKPKCNLGCGMSHGAYAKAMRCILCVALTVCIALCFVNNNHDVLFGNVLTPIPGVSSCMLPSQRFEDDEIAHLQPDPRRECCQLLDKIADQFDDRPGSCDAVVHPSETTDGLVQRQMRPCRAPDVCSAARPIRPLNSLTTGLIVSVAKRDGDVRIAYECRHRRSAAQYRPRTIIRTFDAVTVFVTHDDLYEWLRLPFGFKNTGATVVRAVQSKLWRRGH